MEKLQDERLGSENAPDKGIHERLKVLETRVGLIEAMLARKTAQAEPSDGIEEAIVSRIDDLGVQDLVIAALRLRGGQTRAEIKTTLESWGKPLNNWFDGGNFNNRLVKKGIVIADGNAENDHE